MRFNVHNAYALVSKVKVVGVLSQENYVEEEDFQYLPKTQISRHLYRVQKLSSNYYEFRIAYKQINSETQFPEYIRINNFGHRKTGWNSYKPIKVALTATGNLIL